MYKAIVVGTDGSETAAKAVARAAELAKAFSAQLHLVSAMKPPSRAFVESPIGMMPVADSADWEEEGRRELDNVLQAAARRVKESTGIESHVHGWFGDPVEAIVSVATAQEAGLIVVGNRGMEGTGRFLLGTVPNRISHQTPCDLLIMRTS